MPATANYSASGNLYIDGVLSGIKWASGTLTFSFPSNPTFYEYSGEPGINFKAFSAAQQTATRSILQMDASVANVTFTEITETSTQHATLRLAGSDAPSTAWAYYPSTGAAGGDAWFNVSNHYYDNPIKGNYAFLAIVHELGHALGLKHPHEASGAFGAMPPDHDSLEYSVMSYHSYVGSPTAGYTNGAGGYPQTLMMYDIAGLQAEYGANYLTNSGDTTYGWDPNTGQTFVNGVGQGVPSANRIFLTVWDGGGKDTYDFSSYSTNLNVNLGPGSWTTVSTAQLANLGGSHLAAGNIANALLYQNNPASLIENVIGGSGNDTIVGNVADNEFTGGRGNDFLDGAAGTNTARFSGSASDYSVTQNADGSWTVADLRAGAPDGTDTLKNIQYLKFSNSTLALGTSAPQNSAPVAVDDSYATGMNTQLVLSSGAGVLANDTDPDGNALTAALVSTPSHGSVSLGADGSLIYVPNANFVGTDSFTYKASDGAANSIATATINVHNTPPVITTGATQSVAENTTLVAALTATDADTVGTNPAAFTITGGADQALFGISGGNLVFNAPRDYETQAHSYQVEVTANDGTGATSKTITVNLTDQNDNAPVITTGATQSVAENTTLVAALTATDADTVGTNPATFTITGGADQALFGISGGNLVFNAPRDYETQAHSYQVEVTASDGLNTTLQDITVNLTHQTGVTINGTSGNDLIDSAHTVLNQPLPTLEADTINGSGGNDVISGLGGADYLDGGAGTGDTASYAASTSGVTVSLMTGSGSGGDAQGDTLTNIENLTGSNFDDTLEGNASNNKLVGGLGTDTVSYANATSPDGRGVTVNLGLTKAQNTIGAGTDTLSGFENLTGSQFNDTLTGTTAANVLTGLGGNDTLKGGAGADTMYGGTGNDTYVVDNVGDVVTELDGQGTDTIRSSMSFSLAALAFVENLTLSGSAALGATGNGLDNIIVGNSGANVLQGLGGADTLNGSAGADQMYGGAGNDTYVVDNVGDVVNETGGDGTDTVLSSVSFSLADAVHAIGSIENLTLTGTGAINATGNGLDNVLIGNSGANVLIGGVGADTVDGGGGVDTASYAASAAGVAVSLVTGFGSGGDAEGDRLSNIENLTGSNLDDTLEGNVGHNKLVGGLGIDTVSYAHAGANGVGVTVDLSSTKAQNTVTAGSDTLSGFENLTGSQFNDTLKGNAGNNVISGLSGNDKLTGAGGNDTFVFLPGFGKDTITDFTAGPNSGPHDLIAFDHTIFADFDAVMAASTQVGASTVITFHENTVTLANVSLGSLHHDDFAFV